MAALALTSTVVPPTTPITASGFTAPTPVTFPTAGTITSSDGGLTGFLQALAPIVQSVSSIFTPKPPQFVVPTTTNTVIPPIARPTGPVPSGSTAAPLAVPAPGGNPAAPSVVMIPTGSTAAPATAAPSATWWPWALLAALGLLLVALVTTRRR